jgi:hypothetical protein
MDVVEVLPPPTITAEDAGTHTFQQSMTVYDVNPMEVGYSVVNAFQQETMQDTPAKLEAALGSPELLTSQVINAMAASLCLHSFVQEEKTAFGSTSASASSGQATRAAFERVAPQTNIDAMAAELIKAIDLSEHTTVQKDSPSVSSETTTLTTTTPRSQVVHLRRVAMFTRPNSVLHQVEAATPFVPRPRSMENVNVGLLAMRSFEPLRQKVREQRKPDKTTRAIEVLHANLAVSAVTGVPVVDGEPSCAGRKLLPPCMALSVSHKRQQKLDKRSPTALSTCKM